MLFAPKALEKQGSAWWSAIAAMGYYLPDDGGISKTPGQW